MEPEPTQRSLSMWHALWLVVFALDASLVGRGGAHRLGALAFLLVLGFLVVSELRSTD